MISEETMSFKRLANPSRPEPPNRPISGAPRAPKLHFRPPTAQKLDGLPWSEPTPATPCIEAVSNRLTDTAKLLQSIDLHRRKALAWLPASLADT